MNLTTNRKNNTLVMTLADGTILTTFFYQGVAVMFSLEEHADYVNFARFVVNQPYNNRTYARYYIARSISSAKKYMDVETEYLTRVQFHNELHKLIRLYCSRDNKDNWRW